MLRKYLFVICLSLVASAASAVELALKSVRTTLSKPDTSHTLILQPSTAPKQKTLFHLTPVNNERVGIFVDINGIEIGYAVDIFKTDIETKTQNFLVSYRKLKNAKVTLNYQTLEGLNTRVENLDGEGVESRYLGQTKSKKIELFGLHNLYTFNGKESLFEHFFLNKPRLSDQFDWSLSIVGAWSFKHISIQSEQSIIFTPEFLASSVPAVSKLDSNSFSANVGPFLSLNFPNNVNFFAEYKIGKGYIRNLSEDNGLKQSGDEKSKAFGLGVSWTSQDKKTLVLLRGWDQKGRHVGTSFGDLSYVRFF